MSPFSFQARQVPEDFPAWPSLSHLNNADKCRGFLAEENKSEYEGREEESVFLAETLTECRKFDGWREPERSEMYEDSKGMSEAVSAHRLFEMSGCLATSTALHQGDFVNVLQKTEPLATLPVGDMRSLAFTPFIPSSPHIISPR